MVILLVWLLCSVGIAGEVQLISPVEELKVGQSIEIEVRYVDLTSQRKPTLTAQSGLKLQYKKSSTSALKEQGNYKTVVIFSYVVTAQEEGTWNIGPAKIPDGDHRSEEVTIRVKPQSAGVVPALQLNSSIKHKRFYEGEPFTYNIQFISHLQLYDLNWGIPDLQSFGTLNGLESQQRKYTVLEEEKTVDIIDIEIPLLAKKSGRYEIPPATVSAQVVVSSAQEEQQYGLLSGIQQQTILSEGLRIEVKELPDPPEDFSGLVGQFELRVELQDFKVSLGESASLKVIVEGVGWIRGLDIPESKNAHFLLYDDHPTISRNVRKGKVYSQYILNRAVVPNEEGKWDLDEIAIIVFDTEEEEYITLRSEPARLMVEAGEKPSEIIRFEEQVDLEKGIVHRDIQSAHKDVVIAGERRRNIVYFWFVPFCLGMMCIRRYVSKRLVKSTTLPMDIPEIPTLKFQYYLQQMDQQLAKYKGVTCIQKEDYLQYPEHHQLREKLMAVLYGGEDPEDLEIQIKRILRRKY